MKIYLSHSRAFDFAEELYKPLRESGLAAEHQFIFPHETIGELYPTKQLFVNKGCDLVLAEVSFASTGQGVELGWADMVDLRVVCVYKESIKISESLKTVSNEFFTYNTPAELIEKLSTYLR